MKLFAILFVISFLLAGCIVDTNLYIASDLCDKYDVYENLYDAAVLQDGRDGTHSPELCYCGEHYAYESLRIPTPPLGIREPFELGATPQQFQKSLYQFETIYRITYHQFETEWYGYSFVIWADEPLQDFFFASLDVAGHYWYDDRQLVINTQEIIYEIDELLPGDAIVFSVAFLHYLLPHAGVGFTDSTGVSRRMFISESMRGGCWPAYWLLPLEDDGWAVWR
jgi:hypothetical protein